MAGYINRGIGNNISGSKVVIKKKLASVRFSGKSYSAEQMPSLDSVLSIPQSSWCRGFNDSGKETTQNFNVNRQTCRRYALEDDIDKVLDIICDEAICSVEQNRSFAYIDSDIQIGDKKREQLQTYFNKYRYMLGLMTTDDVWKHFRRFVTDGKIAYRIIYDNSQKNIVDLIEIDPENIERVTNSEGKILYKVKTNDIINGNIGKTVEMMLTEQEIIIISYSDEENNMSYVSRLIRSFNTLRIMESTRIIFSVVNSSLKMQYIVPVGAVSRQKGLQRLSQVAADQAEQVDFNWNTGEIKTNGQPMLPFYKQMFFAMSEGSKPEVSILSNNGGPDLSNMQPIQYFRDKFQDITKIPWTRFDKTTGATFSQNVEGIQREEIRFARFIARLRNIYQMVFIKPIYIQMCLDNDIKDDIAFLSSLHLVYQSDSVFLAEKKLQIAQQNIGAISQMLQSIQTTDAEGNQDPYFDIDFLMNKFSLFTPEELEENRKIKEKKKKEKDKEAAAGQPAMDMSGGAAMPPDAGMDGQGGGFGEMPAEAPPIAPTEAPAEAPTEAPAQ